MTLRITGLASGLDTESIISMLVTLRKQPITKLKEKVIEDDSKIAAYNELKTLSSDLNSAAYNLTLYSTWAGRTATSSDEDVVTASASDGTSTGSYTVKVTTAAAAQRAASNGTTTTASSSGSFTINGTSVSVSSGDSLSTIASAINDADAGVTASVINNTLLIESDSTGASNTMTFTDSSGILKSLGVVDSSAKVVTTNEGYQAAADASFTVNGVSMTSSSNTVTSAVSGVTFKIAGEGTSTVTIGNDTSSIKTMIQDFLDAYNALYSYIDSTTAVTLNSSDEATSAGILQGQYTPNNIENKLYQLMTASVSTGSSDVTSFFSIGISSSDGYQGGFEIDDTTLDTALADNFDYVKNLFKGSNASGYYGIAKQMDTYLKDSVLDSVDGSIPAVLTQLNDDVSDADDRISTLENQLTLYETNLYNHYAAMEDSVNSINSSLQYLLSSLGDTSSS